MPPPDAKRKTGDKRGEALSTPTKWVRFRGRSRPRGQSYFARKAPRDFSQAAIEKTNSGVALIPQQAAYV
ncbi:MAG: hypothetical protein ACK55Z_21175, partial [bacterium]